jgi:hypothetical protein
MWRGVDAWGFLLWYQYRYSQSYKQDAFRTLDCNLIIQNEVEYTPVRRSRGIQISSRRVAK